MDIKTKRLIHLPLSTANPMSIARHSIRNDTVIYSIGIRGSNHVNILSIVF